MPHERTPSDRAAIPVIGGPERFDRFFAREARGVLSVALLVAADGASAEEAVRKAFARALREWQRLGGEPDAVDRVRRWAIDHAWPSPRRRRAAVGDDDAMRFRQALWSMPRRRARLVAVSVFAGDLVADPADLAVSPLTEPWAEQRAALDLVSRLGGVAALEDLTAATVEAIGEEVSTADLDRLRPVGPGHVRWGRAALAALSVAGVVVATLAILRVDTPTEEPRATPTTRAFAARPEVIVLDEAPWWLEYWDGDDTLDYYFPGWERLSGLGAGWFAGVVWTGDRIFGWAYTETMRLGPFYPTLEAFIYDPAADTWTVAAPLPDTRCETFGVKYVTVVEDGVLTVWWTDDGSGCPPAVFYAPGEDQWTPVGGDFFERASNGPLVWTGELLVDPARALAYRWSDGETLSIPEIDGIVRGITQIGAHWTGSEVLALGPFGVLAWAPGDDEWAVVDEASVFSLDRGSAWTTEGLLLARRGGFGFLDGDGWRETGFGLTGACWSHVVPAATPIISYCAGYAVWDHVRGEWMPMPRHALWTWGELVEAGDVWYALGGDMGRFVLLREAGGSIVLPETIPVGTSYLDVPSGFSVAGMSGTAEIPGSLQGGGETWAVRLETEAGEQCMVESTIGGRFVLGGPEGVEEMGSTIIARPQVTDVGAVIFGDGEGAVSLVIDGWRSPDMSAETRVITCHGADHEGALGAATRLAAGTWAAWEGWYGVDGPFTREFQVIDADGDWQFSGPATDPDRERTEKATATFRACVDDFIGEGGFRLAGLRMLVDGEGEVLSLAFRTTRPDRSPPVIEVPDRVRSRCLAVAGVSTEYLEGLGAMVP